jgi:hypothetical protein
MSPITRRKTRIEVPLGAPGHMRQVQYWDDRVMVWCDYGDMVAREDAEAKRARCERGQKP